MPQAQERGQKSALSFAGSIHELKERLQDPLLTDHRQACKHGLRSLGHLAAQQQGSSSRGQLPSKEHEAAVAVVEEVHRRLGDGLADCSSAGQVGPAAAPGLRVIVC